MFNARKINVETQATPLCVVPNGDCTVFVYVSSGTVYLGGSDVTAAHGYPIIGKATIAFDGFEKPDTLYALAVTTNVDVNVLVRTAGKTEADLGRQ